MEWVETKESSVIYKLGYDPASGDLVVILRSGKVVVYRRVEADIWAQLKAAPEPGPAFNRLVKGQHDRRLFGS